jgi:hypothetical protein
VACRSGPEAESLDAAFLEAATGACAPATGAASAAVVGTERRRRLAAPAAASKEIRIFIDGLPELKVKM